MTRDAEGVVDAPAEFMREDEVGSGGEGPREEVVFEERPEGTLVVSMVGFTQRQLSHFVTSKTCPGDHLLPRELVIKKEMVSCFRLRLVLFESSCSKSALLLSSDDFGKLEKLS